MNFCVVSDVFAFGINFGSADYSTNAAGLIGLKSVLIWAVQSGTIIRWRIRGIVPWVRRDVGAMGGSVCLCSGICDHCIHARARQHCEATWRGNIHTRGSSRSLFVRSLLTNSPLRYLSAANFVSANANLMPTPQRRLCPLLMDQIGMISNFVWNKCIIKYFGDAFIPTKFS